MALWLRPSLGAPHYNLGQGTADVAVEPTDTSPRTCTLFIDDQQRERAMFGRLSVTLTDLATALAEFNKWKVAIANGICRAEPFE